MDVDRIEAVLKSPTEEAVSALLDDEGTVFRVDWRQEDETIPDACEDVLRTGRLSGELVNTGTDEGFEVWIRYGKQRVRVPLTYGVGDRHITLCSLNEVLRPEFEVRFFVDSDGSDTLAFVPLPVVTWRELEARYGDTVAERFRRITPQPNLFTDPPP